MGNDWTVLGTVEVEGVVDNEMEVDGVLAFGAGGSLVVDATSDDFNSIFCGTLVLDAATNIEVTVNTEGGLTFPLDIITYINGPAVTVTVDITDAASVVPSRKLLAPVCTASFGPTALTIACVEPTTLAPTTAGPTTAGPTSLAPSTGAPTTAGPTTAPSTDAPGSSTGAPTTEEPAEDTTTTTTTTTTTRDPQGAGIDGQSETSSPLFGAASAGAGVGILLAILVGGFLLLCFLPLLLFCCCFKNKSSDTTTTTVATNDGKTTTTTTTTTEMRSKGKAKREANSSSASSSAASTSGSYGSTVSSSS